MRLLGVALLLVGVVIVAAGTFSGCGALFSWNGRHAIDVKALEAGPVTYPLVPHPGRRYTLVVQVVFAREGLERHEGVIVVKAQMPLVVRVRDEAGTKLAEATGWLDPNEPPNVLYGQAAHESMRGPSPELFVERVIGPFMTASDHPVAVDVDVGADRVEAARIVARRLVIHDDALPPTIRNAFLLAAAGGVLFVVGVVLTLGGWLRRRRKRRGGIPRSDIV